MSRRPAPIRWSVAIIVLHWAMAAALVGMIAGGFVMSAAVKQAAATGNWEARVVGLPIFEAYQLHKSVGVTLWALVIVRLLVRISTRAPALPGTLSRLKIFAAQAVQTGLYGLMFAMPVTGWLVASASPLGLPTEVFGLFILPHAPVSGVTWQMAAGVLHWVGGWALAGLACLHVGAAAKHQFVDKDNVLVAMLPVLSRARTPIVRESGHAS